MRDSARSHVAGEDTLGLSRLFLIAGAASVCASLRQIPDDASSELMQRVHEGIARGEPAAAALRNAQLALRRSTFAHPVNWAGFMLID
jgi:CHAT domain-containing protein